MWKELGEKKIEAEKLKINKKNGNNPVECHLLYLSRSKEDKVQKQGTISPHSCLSSPASSEVTLYNDCRKKDLERRNQYWLL